MILAKGKVFIKNGLNLVHAPTSMLYFTLKGFRPINISNFCFMEKHVGMSFNLRGGSMVLIQLANKLPQQQHFGFFVPQF